MIYENNSTWGYAGACTGFPPGGGRFFRYKALKNTNVGTKEEELETSKEEQKNNIMETITGTLSQLRTNKKKLGVSYIH